MEADIPSADGLSVYLEVIDDVNFATCIHCYLVAGSDSQAGIVVWAKVHESFAGCRVGLFVEGAWNGEATGCISDGKVVGLVLGGVDIEQRCVFARGYIGCTCRENTVLDGGTSG